MSALAYLAIGAAVAAPAIMHKVAPKPGDDFVGASGSTEGGATVTDIGGAWDALSGGGLKGLSDGGSYVWSKANDTVKGAAKGAAFELVLLGIVGIVAWKVYRKVMP
jgi:hypothetical protein